MDLTTNRLPATDLLRDKLDTACDLASAIGQEHLLGAHLSLLRDLDRLIMTAQSAQRTAVGILRGQGKTWQQIGDELGVTRQAAQQLYGR